MNLKMRNRLDKRNNKLWSVTLKMHKLGYFYLSEGRGLLVKIANSINKKDIQQLKQ